MVKLKNRPTLLDNFMAAHSWQKHTIGANALRAATKFVLDSQASAFVGELVRKVGYEMLVHHEFARPPFPITWVELDHLSYWKTLTKQEPDDKADEQWGMFIIDNTAHVISNAVHDKTPLVIPLRFHLHTRISFEEELALSQKVGMSRLLLRKHLIGTIGGGPNESSFDNLVDELCYNHKVELMESWLSKEDIQPHHWNEFMKSCGGDLKLILTLLLLLTRPGRQVLNVTEEPRRTGLLRGKRHVFMAHSVVKLRLEERDPITRVIGGLTTGTHRRNHPVRGHWAETRKKGKGCEHVWEPIDKDHYVCLTCSSKRWWRKDHRRGKFTEGYISREGYEVHR